MALKIAFSVFLAALIVGSLALGHYSPVQAQSNTAPSPPEFSIRYVDHSYDTAPVYGVDQYSGQTIITQQGQHIENKTLEFTIKNQPFTPYVNAEGNAIKMYYYFRYKGPYGDGWSYYPDCSHSYGPFAGGFFPDMAASNSDYTVISITLSSMVNYPYDNPEIPVGATAQFQMQAIIGNLSTSENGYLAGDFYGFNGQRSDWSSTQTITISDGSASTQSPQNPTVTPSPTSIASAVPISTSTPTATAIQSGTNSDVPQLNWFEIGVSAVLGVAVALLAVFLALSRRRIKALEIKQNGV